MGVLMSAMGDLVAVGLVEGVEWYVIVSLSSSISERLECIKSGRDSTVLGCRTTITCSLVPKYLLIIDAEDKELLSVLG